MMYFDVNVSKLCQGLDPLQQDISGYEGICLNTLLTPAELDEYERPLSTPGTTKKVYERVEIRFDNGCKKLDIGKALRFDLFVINLGSSCSLNSAVEMNPDMITFDYTDVTYWFNAGDIREAIKKDIFFEISLFGGLYGNCDKVMWMRNVRRLLKVTEGRNVVVSSGATCPTEARSPWDILKILNGFGIDGSIGRDILRNSIRLLRTCSLKRYPVVVQSSR